MKINTLFFLAVLALLLNNIIFVYVMNSSNHISGEASWGAGQIFLCVGKNVGMFTIYPTKDIVFNDTFTAIVRTDFPNPNGSKFVDFYHYKRGAVPTYLGRDYWDGNNIFTQDVPAGNLSDGNCNYHIEARAWGGCIFTVTISPQFSIDNAQVEPIWDTFKNNISTNFSTYTRWDNISNATLGQPNYGTLTFIGSLNFDGENLDDKVNISLNEISITANRFFFPCADGAPIEITFLNVSQLDPVILLNGKTCGSCNITNETNTTITFVTALLGTVANPTSVYSVKETGGVNLSINLNINGKDVTLNWTDQPLASYYELYYGDNVTHIVNESPYSRPPDISPLLGTNYVDATASNVKERYYYIVAVRDAVKARSPETGAKFDIYLDQGTNLISIPTNTTDNSFNDIARPPDSSYYDKLTKFTATRGFEFATYYGSTWQWWGTYDTFEIDVGYYSFPTQNRYNVTIVGLVLHENQSMGIVTGLNWAGYASFVPQNVDDVVSTTGAGSYGDTISKFTKTRGWERTDYFGPTWQWWGTFDDLEPGLGYVFYPVQVPYTWDYDPLPYNDFINTSTL